MGLGGEGEELAARYLSSNGYRILARNVRSKFGEIDLVARDGAVLCFVEVKARRTSRFGWPEEAVTPLKQHRLRRLAEWYLKARRISGVAVRFDVVSLLLGPRSEDARPFPRSALRPLDGQYPSPARIRLIKGAFE